MPDSWCKVKKVEVSQVDDECSAIELKGGGVECGRIEGGSLKADALKVAALKETVLVFVKPTPPDALGNLD